jgi:ribose transport system permease protein
MFDVRCSMFPLFRMTPATSTRPTFGQTDWVSGRTLGLIMFAGILMIVMSLSSPGFLSEETFFSQSRYIAFYVLVAMSQAICLAIGDMNLAVGAVGSITTVALGLMVAPGYANASPWLAVPLVFLLGPATGLLHGIIITRLKINAFIVTLSTMFVFMGLRSGISGGSAYTMPRSLWWLGQGGIGWLPYLVLIVLAILFGVSVLYGRTVLGRWLIATGTNPIATQFSGINTNRMIVIAHVLSGCFAALAAIVWASWNGNAAPSTGDDWLIISFAVAIIGGTGLKGSLISPMGILMGAIIFKLIQHSLVILKINDNYSNTLLGGLILLAIMMDRAREHFGGEKGQV